MFRKQPENVLFLYPVVTFLLYFVPDSKGRVFPIYYTENTSNFLFVKTNIKLINNENKIWYNSIFFFLLSWKHYDKLALISTRIDKNVSSSPRMFFLLGILLVKLWERPLYNFNNVQNFQNYIFILDISRNFALPRSESLMNCAINTLKRQTHSLF